MKLKLFLPSTFLIVVTLLSCSKDSDSNSGNTVPPNILFIIADDLGKDAISGFTEGIVKPQTPNIDAFRNNGLSFSNFWTYPTCTPTRASIITGKYGYRTAVKGVSDVLSQSEVALQEYINDNTNSNYASAIIGKWHLSGNSATANPETFGIDYYTGLIRGAVDDYYQWPLSEDGANSIQNNYITEVFTDRSIDWLAQQSKPWFLWLAYTAPHTPFHVPPNNMHNQGALPTYAAGMDPLPYYMAAIEAMDFQIGRLLDSLSEAEKENTIIIFIGDNGTPNQVAQNPYTFSTVKNTLFQGGINTPMFISGKGVSRRGSDPNLISSTDLFSTIAQIAGVAENSIYDSKSFNSLFTQASTIREFQYSEMDDGINDAWTISDGFYKLHINANGTTKMYDLVNDTYEVNNLLDGNLSTAAAIAKTELESELLIIRP